MSAISKRFLFLLLFCPLYYFLGPSAAAPDALRDAPNGNWGLEGGVSAVERHALPVPAPSEPTPPAQRLSGPKVPITQDLIQRLYATELTNNDEVLDNLGVPRVGSNSPENFSVANPYEPFFITDAPDPAQLLSVNGIANHKRKPGGRVKFFNQEVVQRWIFSKHEAPLKDEVCAFKFSDAGKVKYDLKTFPSADSALSAGYTVTHADHCGACSSLKDLATYLDKRNLTEPSRYCSKKMGLGNIKDCYMQEIGFTESCAEAWAYNSVNTKKACIGVCVKDYGLFNLIANRYPAELNNPDGSLKPCIQCDELRSVPGYKYTCGRSRRNSGIVADIVRDPKEIYWVDYGQYYRLFGFPEPAAR
jgi:hypothetical protein